MDNIFIQISLLLTMTMIISFFVRLLKQPLLVGYLIAGIIAGPLFFNIIQGGQEMYDAFGQFGIALLLFVIGLNLDLRHLKEIGKVSFITGIGQVLFTMIFGSIILLLMGFSLWSSIFLAVAITFSSTIIIMKLLMEKKDTETVYGRHTIGLMIVQDIIAVVLIIIIGLAKADSGFSLALIFFFFKILILILAIILLSHYVIPYFLRKIADSSEMLFLFTVAWCFGIASIFYLAKASIEVGAIVAGITLASSPFRLEIGSRIRALRDFFLILFFIVLGAQIGMSPISDIWLPSLVLSLFILIGNPLILYFLFRFLKFTRRNSFMVGITAAQVSEFGFVLLYGGATLGFISGRELSIFTIVALLTIFTSSYLIIYNDKIYNYILPLFKYFGADRQRQSEKVSKKFEAWVIGYHRIGWHIVKALKDLNLSVAVIDYDPNVAEGLNHKNIPLFFGDVSDLEFIENLSLSSSKILVLTIPSLDDQLIVINYMQQLNSKAFIIANAYQHNDITKLYEVGADYVMMPHLVGGNWIADILKVGGWSKKSFKKLKDEQSELLISLNS